MPLLRMRALSISSMLLETHTHFHYVHKLVPQLNTVGLIVSVLVSFIKLKLNLPGLQSPPPTPESGFLVSASGDGADGVRQVSQWSFSSSSGIGTILPGFECQLCPSLVCVTLSKLLKLSASVSLRVWPRGFDGMVPTKDQTRPSTCGCSLLLLIPLS